MRRVRLRPANKARWYCAQTKPGMQFFAKERLESQGFKVFMPLTLVQQKKRMPEYRPLFGTYFFVQFNKLLDRWQAIWSTPGVSKLLSGSELEPSPISDTVINSLRAQEVNPSDDWVKLSPIDPGTLVRVTRGPFADHVGICKISSQDRVSLLFKIMGKEVDCYFTRVDVEVASAAN